MSINIMSWNIENLGAKKLGYNLKYNSKIRVNPGNLVFEYFCNYVASIIFYEDIDILGIMEVRGNFGNHLGHGIVESIKNNFGLDAYDSFASQQSNDKRKEQYLFIWKKEIQVDKNLFTSAPINVLDGKEMHYFPLLRDRGPFMGIFGLPYSGDIIQLPIVMFHARGPGSIPEAGNELLAYIGNLYPDLFPHGALVMGDFNISPSPIKSRNRAAIRSFQLLSENIDMDAQITGRNKNIHPLTSLKPVRFDPQDDIDSIFSKDFDNFYFRLNVPHTRILGSMENMLLRSIPNSGIYNHEIDQNFCTYLCTRYRNSPTIISAIYSDLRSLFSDWRRNISDHMPVILRIE